MVPSEEAYKQKNTTNYFMYQWAGARLPPGGQIRVQAAPASELILYIGPHLTPDLRSYQFAQRCQEEIV